MSELTGPGVSTCERHKSRASRQKSGRRRPMRRSVTITLRDRPIDYKSRFLCKNEVQNPAHFVSVVGWKQ
jgi:hypothetical protein